MKNVLLMVHADAGQEGRFQAALDLTRALNGHLTCVDVFVPQVIADDVYMGSGSAYAVAAEFAAERDLGAAVKRRLQVEDVPWDWIDATGGLSTRITDEAGLADVIVSSLQADHMFDPNLPRVTANLALANNQPVVAVPVSSRGVDWNGRALVAWDGSAAAMAALRASVPILALASDVELLEVDDRTSGPSAEAAAQYLSRHGIPSTIERIHSLHRPTAELILGRAEAIAADYVIMGAYGHNRTRELFFGGVTRSMMHSSPVPLVLAH
jgi:nucleotide-binding universal stress UspA family protein